MRVSQIRQRESFQRSPRWPAVAIAVAILLLVQPAAGAAGFGSLRVRSNLGQPLQAEIDLIGITEQEGQHLAVRLASAEAYQRAGLTYNPIVSTLRASLVRSSDGGYVVRIRSAQPIGEPIVDILVDLTWGSGRLSRAYTFLLDPAGPANTVQVAAPAAVVQAAAPTAAASVPAPATASRSRAPVPPASLPTARPARQTRQAARPQPAAPAAPAADTAPGRTYTVRRGDSLYDIASNAVPGQDAASLNRTLLALHHDNPGAFVGGNINRLRVGSVLKLPPAVNTLIVSVRESRQEGAEQTAGLAGDRSRAADADAVRQRAGSGPARMRDQAASPAGVVPAAEDPALKAMESRVAELEKNLTEMQRQLALKNEELARLAAATAAAPMAASTPAPSTGAPASAPVAQVPAPIAPAAPIEAATVAPAPVAEASAPAAAPGNTPAAVRPHARQASWFWSLLGNPMVLGLVALLGGWAVYRRSQPKPERAHGFQNSLLSREHTVLANANSLFGPAGAQNIDTAQHSVFGADFRVGGGGDNNDVDPIAEADVYIAYGRDVQAEEILRETLVQQPERMAIRFKLLDIYANRQDAQGFQSVAEDLLARVGAASPEWAEAAALGRTIDPDNPLYLTVQGDTLPAQAQVQAQAAPEPVAPVPQPEADTAAAEAPEAAEAAEAAETDDLPRPSTALVPQDPDTAPSAPSAKTPPSADLELLP
ncbi:FimV family protein [Ralstonia solanacearum]|uniref:type IV pilus assembly protein FimV n=1 Tax=Ralstonia solanacearum TaxID=305 RepID=UPI0023051C76|nr:FimV/HubP family polar landmark protein [Ralstonia solanacearum]MDB0568254.1 pilus assembly protein [Ralstonia solanacearum]MDB0576769.1 pilus assembly protein [Ralstonia solanacearum]